MIKTGEVIKALLRVVALLAMVTATFTVAQESSAPTGIADGGVNGNVSADAADGSGRRGVATGAASQWGVHLSPANTGESSWGITRNSVPSSRLVAGSAGAHATASAQDHPVSGGAVPSKREVRPGRGGIAVGAAASPGATAVGKSRFAFSGTSHVTRSHGSGGRKTADSLIAEQIKGHATARPHHGGRRGHPAKSNRDSEPVAPKGETDCENSSKLGLCIWL